MRLTTVPFLLLVLLPMRAQIPPHQASFPSGNQTIPYEVFPAARPQAPILILLHGSSGPASPTYQQEAQFLRTAGYTVLLPHYLAATSGSNSTTPENYLRWVAAVEDLVRECAHRPELAGRPISLIGLSLGASVALAAGSQGLPVQSVVDWYGSLPDEFFLRFKSMPPLLILHGELDRNVPAVNGHQLVRLCEMKQLICENHFYPDQSHGFTAAALDDANRRTLSFLAQTAKQPPATAAP